MPDHVHAIIMIAPHATVSPDGMRPADDGDGDGGGGDGGGGDGDGGGGPARNPNDMELGDHNPTGLGIQVDAGSLGAIVRSYKAAVARRVNRARRSHGADVWQRGYYERILHGPEALGRVRRYIAANPERYRAALDDLLRRMRRCG